MILQGGIGNQLFQYTAALQISQVLRRQVLLSPVQLNKHSNKDYRSTLYKRLKSVEKLDAPYVMVLDAYKPWDPVDFNVPYSVALRGYFQYLPSIMPVLPVVCEDLRVFLESRRKTIAEKYYIREPNNYGFIHVRRGDYVSSNQGTHWVQDIEYYKEALSHAKHIKSWFVISDDTAWCRRQDCFALFEIAEEPGELEGLALMSLCNGAAIIGNSTYSWWGAMIGAEKWRGTVVYPSKWYAEEEPILFPEAWKEI